MRRYAFASLLLASCVNDVQTTDAGVMDSGNQSDAVTQMDGGSDAGGLAMLSLMPPNPFLRKGTSLDVTVNIDRKGVTGPIALTAMGAPMGTTISIAPIGDGTMSTQMKITSMPNAIVGGFPITLKAPNVADFVFSLLVGDASGALDTSFDNDGVLLDGTAANAQLNAVAVQNDGKIIVAGSAAVPSGTWIVRRYDIDGTPDMPFNTAAAQILPPNGTARAIAIDPKGRIVIGGNTTPSGNQMTILRFNPNGQPDQSFDGDGVVTTTPILFPEAPIANGIAIRPDSSILVAVETTTQSHGRVYRFLENGSQDTGFAFSTGNGASTGRLNRVFALPQDAVFATGLTLATVPGSPLAVRLQPSGAPDMNFAPGGTINYPSAGGCSALGATQTTGGDILIVGFNVNQQSSCELRIGANGMVKNLASASGPNGSLSGAAPAPNDGTYTAGWAGGSMDKKGYVRRRLASNALDPMFGTNGEVIFDDMMSPDMYFLAFTAVTTMPDGRVVAVGRRNGTNSGALVVRLWF